MNTMLPSWGTRIFFTTEFPLAPLDSSGYAILEMNGPQEIPNIDAGDREVFDYDSPYYAAGTGAVKPAAISIPLYFYAKDMSFQALKWMRDRGASGRFMVLFQDQPSSPTSLGMDGRLVSPGPTTAEFSAVVTNCDVDSISNGGVVQATLALQRTSKVRWDLPSPVIP
jgi:hypothetical protein